MARILQPSYKVGMHYMHMIRLKFNYTFPTPASKPGKQVFRPSMQPIVQLTPLLSGHTILLPGLSTALQSF